MINGLVDISFTALSNEASAFSPADRPSKRRACDSIQCKVLAVWVACALALHDSCNTEMIDDIIRIQDIKQFLADRFDLDSSEELRQGTAVAI
jgi:hypothetical protein